VRPLHDHGGRLQLQQTGNHTIHDGPGSEVERICLPSTALSTARRACPINYDYLVFRLTSPFPISPITTLPACLGWQALHGCWLACGMGGHVMAWRPDIKLFIMGTSVA